MALGAHVTRRNLLIGGGAAIGLVVAWAGWPRRYAPNLVAGPGETVFDAFLKIAESGVVTVVVPQAELGQGSWTALPQILADELGADWRTIAVEPAPISPLYANRLLVAEKAEASAPAALAGLAEWAGAEFATRATVMVTGGSSSIRSFEAPLRAAGAAARAQLCRAAAKRWKIDPAACDTRAGFVVRGADRLRFGELAAEAAGMEPPARVELRPVGAGAISGVSVPRIDLPAKVDGSARFAGDVRLPEMVFASVRHGPVGRTVLAGITAAPADAIPGVLGVFEFHDWAAAIATNWWAADRALGVIHPTFETDGGLPDSASVRRSLEAALASEGGTRHFARGDLKAAFAGGHLVTARYSAGFAAHAAIEPLVATARVTGDRVEIWAPTQAPAIMRDAVARALDIAAGQVTLYPIWAGGSFGRKIETHAAVQAALLARLAKRPVQLMWSRGEEMRRGFHRPPALARMTARLAADNTLGGMQCQIAAPSTARELARRLMPGLPIGDAPQGEQAAVEGADVPYTIGAFAADHHPAEIGVATGMWRSVAHSYTAFFVESFVDEMSRVAGVEPLSFRMAMLGGHPRLARCLQLAASRGDWQGGVAGSGQGIAAHSAFGSHVAMLVEARVGDDRAIAVDRVVCAVDCGRVVNPDNVRQQIEGGIIWGIAAALGDEVTYSAGIADQKNFADLHLPRLADCPEIVIELVPSREAPGGVGEIAVPPVAPAIANALFAATGRRMRDLPLRMV